MAKGQIWSYDMLIATVVFMLTVTLIASFWWSAASTIGEKPGERMTATGADFADVLLSPGNPYDWHERLDTANTGTWGSNVTLVGMGSGFEVPLISGDKALALIEMDETNYSELKGMFRLGYNFYVEVMEFYNCSSAGIQSSPLNCTARGIAADSEEWNSTAHYVWIGGRNFTLGVAPNSTALSASVSNRYAIYNNSLVRVRVILWNNQTWQ